MAGIVIGIGIFFSFEGYRILLGINKVPYIPALASSIVLFGLAAIFILFSVSLLRSLWRGTFEYSIAQEG